MRALSKVVEEEGHPWDVLLARGQVRGIKQDTGGRNPRKSMDHRREKIIQEGRKGKINQFRNILNCTPGNHPQGETSLLVVM